VLHSKENSESFLIIIRDHYRTIECIVYYNPTEADKWAKIKHAGQNEVAWPSLPLIT
jgi:hypothetical protein